MSCGDFARGWDEYVWAWRIQQKRPLYPYLDRIALWNGDPFPGKTLLVSHEQGFGDAIQAARYLPAVKARGGRVILETSPPLRRLFAGYEGVDELRSAGTGISGDVDVHVPLLGLPLAFATRLDSIPLGFRICGRVKRASSAGEDGWNERVDCASGSYGRATPATSMTATARPGSKTWRRWARSTASSGSA